MCGIVGILNLLPELPPIEENMLGYMRDTMTHRGPDSSGIWTSKNGVVGLGHRRLSIIDLTPTGHQPMCNEDGSVWITFNGEIYNHLELRKELESLSHRYRSSSDTESVIHAYEEWGVKAVEHIDGMFSFAIWDEKLHQLWLVRDRMGKKPLYFTEVEGRFIFASETKAILAHPLVRREINQEALGHYLTFAVSPAPLTLFKNIYKLPPATHLVIPQNKRWIFTEYWRPWFATDHSPKTMEEYADEVGATLQNAVKKRLMSDVPFGVFLSGGVDSSANVALMSQLMNRPVDTYSVGFKDQSQAPYNEIQYARQMATLFKTNHHEVLISDQHFFDFIDQLAFYQDEPLADPVCFPLFYVSKLAREHGTIVIQVGEGSDELFAGYEVYRNYLRRYHLYWKRFQSLPKWIQKSIASAGSPFLGSRSKAHLQRAVNGEPIFLGGVFAFLDLEKEFLMKGSETSSLRNSSFRSSASLCAESYEGKNPSMQMLSNHFQNAEILSLPQINDASENDFLKKMIHWECHQRLAELLLMRLDKMMMANSVEGRAPFLDTQLVQLAMRMPSSMKMTGRLGKAVLKKAVEPLLPHELVYRKKIGFCGGSGNMLTPAIFEFAKQTILSILPKYDWPIAPLESLITDHQNGMRENSFQIWNLMNLALWLKRWF